MKILSSTLNVPCVKPTCIVLYILDAKKLPLLFLAFQIQKSQEESVLFASTRQFSFIVENRRLSRTFLHILQPDNSNNSNTSNNSMIEPKQV